METEWEREEGVFVCARIIVTQDYQSWVSLSDLSSYDQVILKLYSNLFSKVCAKLINNFFQAETKTHSSQQLQ